MTPGEHLPGGRVLYVDVVGGAAGDMLLAALIDAGAPLEGVRDAVDAVVPGRFDIDVEEVRRGGIRAARLAIRSRDGGAVGEPAPRPFRDLIDAVEGSGLSPAVRTEALAILGRLGDAEARVHGVGVEEVLLHELGDDDTLLDVVGFAAAAAALGVDEVLVSPLPLGVGGTKGSPHGRVPLPAPLTVDLLRGFPVRGGWAGETVTPTAAAIIATLARPARSFPAMTIDAVGYGAGTDDPEDVSNIVRIVVGTPAQEAGATDGTAGERTLVLLEANLDDLAPELVADAAAALLAAGALDAWTTQVVMKKGRPGAVLSALADPGEEERLRRVFFEETSTFGVRVSTVRRSELERRVQRVALSEGEVRVKVGLLQGRTVSVTPEHDDVMALARRTGRAVREVYEEASAAARALRFSGAGPGAGEWP